MTSDKANTEIAITKPEEHKLMNMFTKNILGRSADDIKKVKNGNRQVEDARTTETLKEQSNKKT